MNVIAFFHAYKFTHFSNAATRKTAGAGQLTASEKLSTAFFGVNFPRPQNNFHPSQIFQTIRLQSNKEIECWYIQADKAKGTIIIFHGYGGQKASMIDKSDEFIRLGYNTLLVDFMGSGGSEGNQTTIGYKEADQVKTAYDYLIKKGEKKVYLFGTSLGAAAILKSLDKFNYAPTGIIIECPFGSMYKTVCARFHAMNIPTIPMAGLLVFWGGVQNGFWAFSHNPAEYAKSVTVPTLLLYGEKDPKVSRDEINGIYQNLKGFKMLRTYPKAGHENYLLQHRKEWLFDVQTFLNQTAK